MRGRGGYAAFRDAPFGVRGEGAGGCVCMGGCDRGLRKDVERVGMILARGEIVICRCNAPLRSRPRR